MMLDMTETRIREPNPWHIFLVFLRLGLTSFGGPVAHLGYFREEFVHRRRWLTEQRYADLVALCQFLPGPASSQVGMGVGLYQAGHAGALAAWLGFTLPSAIALFLLATGLDTFQDLVPDGLLHGLKVVAVAVIAQAVWGMGRALCPDRLRVSLMMVSTGLAVLWPGVAGQLLVIALGASIGLWLLSDKAAAPAASGPGRATGRGRAWLWLVLFGLLLTAFPLATAFSSAPASIALFDVFFRAGSLVFGGGHVVLPLLQAELVPTGWVTQDAFLAGYGAAQAVPGPLFTFAAFLGASSEMEPSGWHGACLAVLAIFMPSFLLVAGVLPYWERLRQYTRVQAALSGIHASVVGLLLAALYDPVWTGAIRTGHDFVLALAALVALMFWKLPPWVVVIACAMGGVLVVRL
jgi:chromate transporter